jgi:hypothetical protein
MNSKEKSGSVSIGNFCFGIEAILVCFFEDVKENDPNWVTQFFGIG